MAGNRRHYRRGRRSKRRGFASWSIGKKIGLILGGTVAFVAAAGVGILASKLSKIDHVSLNPEELNVSVEAQEQKKHRERGTGYLNVALFGVDSRDNELEEGTRSDTIMVASLNRETLEVKIASVYRDTLLEQRGGALDKANAAYSYGGPEDAVAMLNKNLDLDIEHYVTVNFNSLIDVVDAVGGIEIDIQQEEIPYVCGYVMELMKVTGKVSAGVTEPGPQVLNGMQATAYARIRHTTGDDYRRTERQRDVLTKIVEKLQGVSVAQLNEIIDKVFPEVSTNFTLAEILDYAIDAFDYKLGETVGFPFDKTTDKLANIGDSIIPVTLESNVEELHKFLFGDSENYTPSGTIASIDDKITAKVGNKEADPSEANQGFMEQPAESYPSTGNGNNSYGNGYSGNGTTGTNGTGTGTGTGNGTNGSGNNGTSGGTGGGGTGGTEGGTGGTEGETGGGTGGAEGDTGGADLPTGGEGPGASGPSGGGVGGE